MFGLGLTKAVTPLPGPVSMQGLHIVRSMSQRCGSAHHPLVEVGPAKPHQSERENKIVRRRSVQFLDQIKS